MKNREITFGIMCHGTTFKRWQADTILNLLAIEGVKPKLLIIENKKSKIKALLDIFKIIKFSNILWFLWCYSWPIKSKALKSINLSKELIEYFKTKTVKGEIVIVVEGKPQEN